MKNESKKDKLKLKITTLQQKLEENYLLLRKMELVEIESKIKSHIKKCYKYKYLNEYFKVQKVQGDSLFALTVDFDSNKTFYGIRSGLKFILDWTDVVEVSYDEFNQIFIEAKTFLLQSETI